LIQAGHTSKMDLPSTASTNGLQPFCKMTESSTGLPIASQFCNITLLHNISKQSALRFEQKNRKESDGKVYLSYASCQVVSVV